MKSSLWVRSLGGFSALLLALGATGPLVKALLMTAHLSDVSPVRVGLLLLIAAGALVLSIVGRTSLLRWTALAAILTLASLGLGGEEKYIPGVSEITKLLLEVLKALFTDVAKAVIHLQWGGYCLVGGLLLMLVTSFIKTKPSSET